MSQDGTSHYLKGLALLLCYIVVAACFFISKTTLCKDTQHLFKLTWKFTLYSLPSIVVPFYDIVLTHVLQTTKMPSIWEWSQQLQSSQPNRWVQIECLHLYANLIEQNWLEINNGHYECRLRPFRVNPWTEFRHIETSKDWMHLLFFHFSTTFLESNHFAFCLPMIFVMPSKLKWMFCWKSRHQCRCSMKTSHSICHVQICECWWHMAQMLFHSVAK